MVLPLAGQVIVQKSSPPTKSDNMVTLTIAEKSGKGRCIGNLTLLIALDFQIGLPRHQHLVMH